MIDLIAKAYRLLIRFGTFTAPLILLIIRLGWGWYCFDSGRGHLMNLDKTTDFFRSLHIPAPHLNAIMAGTTEMVGGILLMIGFASRAAALALVFNFAVAIITDAHDQLAHAFTDPEKLVDYAAFPFFVAAAVVLAFGPGIISVDGILKRTVFRKYAVQLPPSP